MITFTSLRTDLLRPDLLRTDLLRPGATRVASVRAAAAGALRDAWSVLAPTDCSGCGAPDRALCAACARELRADPHRHEREGVVVWAGLEYAGAVRRVLGNFKDGGRTDAAAALAVPLRAVLVAALADHVTAGHARPDGGVHLVTVPGTAAAWRARGYHPVELILARAGLAPTPVLRLTGQTIDQVGLGRSERMRNKAGSLRARRDLTGLTCIIVDDILTTGATVLEARRAVTEAGGQVCFLATLAQTRRRLPDAHRSPESG